MRTRFDQLAKGMLDEVLSTAGEVRAQEEIPGEVQAADVWFQPAPGKAAARAQLGLLGRIAATSCLIEPFHTTPGAGPVLECVSKQLTLRRNLVREARRTSSDAPVLPRLWILSTGRPRSVLSGLRFEPLSGWPAGIWQGPPLLRTYVVSLRDLPATRATLPLRLLGAGRAFWRAVEELHALPEETWEHRLLIPLLIANRIEISQDPGELSEVDMGYADRLRAIYDEWERRLREQGEAKGIRTSIVALYRMRFGDLPPELNAAIEATNDVSTLRHWVELSASASAEELAAAMRSGQPR